MDIVLTSGQFVLSGVLQNIKDYGVAVRSFHYPLPFAEDDVDRMYPSGAKEKVDGNIVDKAISDMISYFGIGGRGIVDEGVPISDITKALFRNNCNHVNYTIEYMLNIIKNFNVKLILVHSDTASHFAAMCLLARKFDIPTVCLYNGYISFIHQKYSAVNLYNVSSLYLLRGTFEEEFISSRECACNNITLGTPSWDTYYDKLSYSREENTFLFSPSSERTRVSGIRENKNTMLVTNLFPCWWHHDIEDDSLNTNLYTAFAKYQKYNPSAKFLMSLRQFSGYNIDSMKKMLDTHGIKNYEIVPFEILPFRELIKKVSYNICGFSTTAIEGVVSRTPTLCITGPKFPIDYWNSNGSMYHTVGNVDTIYSGIKHIVENRELLISKSNERAEYYNYKDDGGATQRITDFIINTYLR